MKTISRYIMTLALLITAVTGAWAEDEVLLTTVTATGLNTYSQSPDGIVTVTLDNISSYGGTWGWLESGSVTVEAAQGYTITRCVFKQNPNSQPSRVIVDDQAPFTATMVEVNYGEDYYVSAATSTGNVIGADFMNGISIIEVYGTAEPGIEVTTDAASEQDLFTEASFEMPAFDATAEYELVRDMSIQMTATMGDGTDGVRYRVQWNDEKDTFEPADMDYEQVMALFSVYDDIEEKKLTANTDYTVQLYAIDDEGNPTGDAMDFTNFTLAPGRYYVTASAQLDAPYDGTTAPSNIFELFQGYEIKVAAGEYATYYKDEALKVEDQEVELLTITAVEDGKAILSDASDAMPTNTPFLVHNNGTEEKTILLIPCNEPNLAVTVADEFIGTLTGKEFTEDDMATGDFYVCNGKEFIKVRGAGTLAPNKAYLKVNGNNAPLSIPFRRSIGGGEGTTGIDASLVNSEEVNSVWYDLNGRRLQGKPSQKGIYIKNGKKIVVK